MTTDTRLQKHTEALVHYLLWEADEWRGLLENAGLDYERGGDALMKAWEDRDDSDSPFYKHIVTHSLLLWEEVFGYKAEDSVADYARKKGYTFAADEEGE